MTQTCGMLPNFLSRRVYRCRHFQSQFVAVVESKYWFKNGFGSWFAIILQPSASIGCRCNSAWVCKRHINGLIEMFSRASLALRSFSFSRRASDVSWHSSCTFPNNRNPCAVAIESIHLHNKLSVNEVNVNRKLIMIKLHVSCANCSEIQR